MFTKGFDTFVCEGDFITCEVDGFTVTARVERDDNGDRPDDRDDGFWPSQDPKSAGYVLPANYEAQNELAHRVMDAWLNDEWHYYGVCVSVSKAGIELTDGYGAALWGIEGNYPGSDNSSLTEVANELLDDALDAARKVLAKLCA